MKISSLKKRIVILDKLCTIFATITVLSFISVIGYVGGYELSNTLHIGRTIISVVVCALSSLCTEICCNYMKFYYRKMCKIVKGK